MIDYQRKLVFLHLPKSGGTSIETALLGDPRLKDHDSFIRTELITGDYKENFLGIHHPHGNFERHVRQLGEQASQFKFFTVIRNPFDIAVSRFSYQFRYKPREFFTRENFKWALKALPGKWRMNYESLIEYEGEKRLDYILQFCSFQEEMDRMFHDLGMDSIKIEHDNKGQIDPDKYRNFYDQETEELVRKYYRYEIDRFGWKLHEGSVRRPITFNGLPPGDQELLRGKLIKPDRTTLSRTLLQKAKDQFWKAIPSRFKPSIKFGYDSARASLKVANIYFSARRPDTAETISAFVCSYPDRLALLKYTVWSLLPQVDHLYVYLNNIDAVPWWLEHSRIHVVAGKDALGDLKSNGKFYSTAMVKGFHLIVDDDIIYPADYAKRIIEKIEKYNRQSILCVHGSLLTVHFLSYYKSKIVFHFENELEIDSVVDIASTPAYHTDGFLVTLEDLDQPNCDDAYLSIKARRQGIRIICMDRKKGWLQKTIGYYNESSTIYYNREHYDSFVTQLIIDSGLFAQTQISTPASKR